MAIQPYPVPARPAEQFALAEHERLDSGDPHATSSQSLNRFTAGFTQG
jgi:hypothetical protein